MQDNAGMGIRARAWVTKIDHSVDPPRPVEEVFVENGVVLGRRALSGEEKEEDMARDLKHVLDLLDAMTAPAGTSADHQGGWDACRAEARSVVARWMAEDATAPRKGEAADAPR